jgi:hypothetical protein
MSDLTPDIARQEQETARRCHAQLLRARRPRPNESGRPHAQGREENKLLREQVVAVGEGFEGFGALAP